VALFVKIKDSVKGRCFFAESGEWHRQESPMDKIEFSDINKFITSLGLIFIGAGLLLPWFINQNIDLIVLEQTQIDKTTESAKAIITRQQDYILYISQHINAIVITLYTLGVILLIAGIMRWKERQKVIDKIQNEDLKSKIFHNLSLAEKKEMIKEELGSTVANPASRISKYIEVENSLYLKIVQHYKTNYSTSKDIRLGQFTYDVILKSKYLEKRGDVILEIKLYNELPPKGQLLETAKKFILSINHYENTQRRMVMPVMAVVVETLDPQKASALKAELKAELSDIRPDLIINFIEEKDIQALPANKILRED
jgi:hypothetical protein